LLDLDRNRLIHQRFTHFLPPTSQDAFYLLCQRVFKSDTRQAAELELVSARFNRLVVQLEAVRDASSRGKHCRVSLLDITDRKRLEQQILEISDNEQARIGQDIHDGLCQQLVSLSFDANLMESQLSAQRPPDLAVAHRIASRLDQATTYARELSRGLFPIRLETDGLPPALEELARTTSQRNGIRTRFQGDERVTLASRNVATHLYRIAQEAVNNAVKHGRPRLITIRLNTKGHQLVLSVEDDGGGVILPKEPDKLSGMGMHIMEYRSRSIGATLLVSPGARGGTVVTCCLPWKKGDPPLA
jgi:signal transduction histidine kinase